MLVRLAPLNMARCDELLVELKGKYGDQPHKPMGVAGEPYYEVIWTESEGTRISYLRLGDVLCSVSYGGDAQNDGTL